jgi:protein-S-isoprenylcysteine O-methyltransferase Ste14
MESHKHKIVPPVYVLISVLTIVLIHFIIPGPDIFPKPWNLLGILPLLAGLVPPVLAVMAFRRAGTSPEPFHEPAAMVTSGIYGISRNPIYLGFLLFLLGVVVLLRTLVPFVVLVGYVVLIQRNVIRVEEGILAAKFGARWVEYKQRTRRWL